MTTIYLSSTYEDLKEYREAVKLKALYESGDELSCCRTTPPRTIGRGQWLALPTIDHFA